MSAKKDESSGESTKDQSLGEFLRTIRLSMPMTLREAEDASGVSNAYLSQLEQGKILKTLAPLSAQACRGVWRQL